MELEKLLEGGLKGLEAKKTAKAKPVAPVPVVPGPRPAQIVQNPVLPPGYPAPPPYVFPAPHMMMNPINQLNPQFNGGMPPIQPAFYLPVPVAPFQPNLNQIQLPARRDRGRKRRK